jgi:Ca2+-binding RTX toxin-like protein
VRRTLGLAAASLALAASLIGFDGGARATAVYDVCANEYEPAPGDGLTIKGTSRADILLGTEGPDIIYGYGGGDLICGFGDDDVIYGGSGDDHLFGGEGDDTILAGSGHDHVYDIDGWNDIAGETGEDEIWGYGVLSGGSADDYLNTYLSVNGPRAAEVTVNSTLDGGSGNDFIVGSEVGGETLLGGSGNDYLDGVAGADVLNCGSGLDQYNQEGDDEVTKCEIDVS